MTEHTTGTVAVRAVSATVREAPGLRPTAACINRIKRDLTQVMSSPLPLIFVAPDEDNILKVDAILVGPFDTPYEGGFFHFSIKFPLDYPWSPPTVELMTTDDGRVRFNPNLYKNGKVCLSILGTWEGPPWRPINTLSSVLLSVQSLMNEKPYHNEPGYEEEINAGAVNGYNQLIRHETMRVAVCGMMEQRKNMPKSIRLFLESSFTEFYDSYMATCEKNADLNGSPMVDPFGSSKRNFSFATSLTRLQKLFVELSTQLVPEELQEDISFSSVSATDS